MYIILFLSLIVLAISVFGFYSTAQILKEYKLIHGKDFERFLNGHK